jgi:hypothetical protein
MLCCLDQRDRYSVGDLMLLCCDARFPPPVIERGGKGCDTRPPLKLFSDREGGERV